MTRASLFASLIPLSLALLSAGCEPEDGPKGKKPIECPAIAQIAPDCDGGTVVPVIDPATGCTTGYACDNTCPAIIQIAPDCDSGTVVPRIDPVSGCTTGYECSRGSTRT